MFPFDTGPALSCVEAVADDDDDGHAIAIRVVDAHCRMLQPDGSMRHHSDRLAFDLRIGMRHRHRRLFVAAGDELGFLIPTIINDGLVQRAEAGARVGADVIQVEGSQDIDHEVRPAVFRRQDVHFGRSTGFSAWILEWRAACRPGGGRGESSLTRRRQCCRSGNSRTLQEFPAIGRKLP